MNINYTARHSKITPEIKKYCERRLSSIEKLLRYPVEADLIFSVEKYRKKVEINIKTKGATINTIKETQDIFSSLGVAFDHLDKRVKKEKEKLRERKRRKNKEIEAFPQIIEEEERKGRIIKSRDFSMKPMSIEEALLQFSASKREVFVFRNFETEKWATLYRRKDGHFGLVEPE